MKITAYRSSRFKNTETYYTDSIMGVEPPDEMTDETREMLNGDMRPMLCFVPRDNSIGITDTSGRICVGHSVCLPVEFIISIEEE